MKKLGGQLPQTLKALKATKGVARVRIFEAWRLVVGDLLARHSTPFKVHGSKLLVRVSAAAWATEIQLRQQEILQRLARHLGEDPLKEIRCTVSWDGTRPAQPPPKPEPSPVTAMPVSPERLEEILRICSEIADPDLREKVEKAMTAQAQRELYQVQQGKLPCPLCGRFRSPQEALCRGCERERRSQRETTILQSMARAPWNTQRDLQADFPDLSGAEYRRLRNRLRSLLKERVWQAYWGVSPGDPLPAAMRANIMDFTMLTTGLPFTQLEKRHFYFALGEKLAKAYLEDKKPDKSRG